MMSRWIVWCRSQAVRIDAISLRERILMFVTVVACLGALANWTWLTPAQEAHAQLLLQFDQQVTDLQKARTDLAAVARPAATDATVRSELVDVRRQTDAVRQTLAELTSSSLKQTTPLTQLLVHLLHQHDGLTLLRAATMNASALTPGPASGAPAAVLPDGLVRQGVELTVTGPYAELTRYIQTLEQSMPQVRWGTMWLRSEKQPPELTLQLYLVETRTP